MSNQPQASTSASGGASVPAAPPQAPIQVTIDYSSARMDTDVFKDLPVFGEGIKTWSLFAKRAKAALKEKKVWYIVEEGVEVDAVIEKPTDTQPEIDAKRAARKIREEHDTIAVNALLSKMSAKQLQNVVDLDHAKDIWDRLEGNNQVNSVSQALAYRQQLHAVKYKTGANMGDHLGVIARLVFEYNQISKTKITEEEHMLIILESLPTDDPEWMTLKTLLENEAATASAQEFEIVEVQPAGAAGQGAAAPVTKKAVAKARPGSLILMITSRLNVQAAKIAARQPTYLFDAASFPGRGNGRRGGQQRKSDATCFNCGKRGHFKRDCWRAGGGKAGQGPNNRQGRSQDDVGASHGSANNAQHTAFLARLVQDDLSTIGATLAINDNGEDAQVDQERHGQVDGRGADEDEGKMDDTSCTIHKAFVVVKHPSNTKTWLIDSGASSCFVSDRSALFNFREATGSVSVGDNRKLAIKGCGDVILVPTEEPETRIVLTNCSFVPDLAGNLLS
ncbi:hypothetical protein HDU96_010391, partial [Phlyctochytrium bullatum]